MINFKKWYPAIVVMILIFIASSVHGSTINSIGLGKEAYHIDGHFVMYFFLGAAYYYALNSKFKAVILAMLYGITDEFHQLFVPMRAFQVFDMAVDTVGGFIGVIILWKLLPILAKKLNKKQ